MAIEVNEENEGFQGASKVAKGKKTVKDSLSGTDKQVVWIFQKAINPYTKTDRIRCNKNAMKVTNPIKCSRKIDFVGRQKEICCEPPKRGANEDDKNEYKESNGRTLRFLQKVDEDWRVIKCSWGIGRKTASHYIRALIVLPSTMVSIMQELVLKFFTFSPLNLFLKVFCRTQPKVKESRRS